MSPEAPGESSPIITCRPLRIAALIKQVPVAESLTLGPDGRLQREGAALEMNPYCRRAVSKGVELAHDTGGTCTVLTLGPASAEDVLREAVAWGATDAVHLCDEAFAGSDTLATARALVAALARWGPFDLVLVGRNTVDGETGQVGPEIAALCDLSFAAGVRQLVLDGERLELELELDDGRASLTTGLPSLLSVAERLCEPCKVDPAGRAAVDSATITRCLAAELGPGPWGQAGSPTIVRSVRTLPHHREGLVLSGSLEAQTRQAVAHLRARDALTGSSSTHPSGEALTEPLAPSLARDVGSSGDIVVVLEPGRPTVGLELIGAAARLAGQVGASVIALLTGHADGRTEGRPESRPWADVDELIELPEGLVEEDIARALVKLAEQRQPWAVLAPSTAFGREVAGRAAAALGAGLIGDAIAIEVVEGRLVAAKPAFSGASVADISCTSSIQMVTVRPGVLPLPPPAPLPLPLPLPLPAPLPLPLPLPAPLPLPPSPPAGRDERTGDARPANLNQQTPPKRTRLHQTPRGRVEIRSRTQDDDLEVLARAEVVIGVGTGVAPDEFGDLTTLSAILGAELAATRKVTDMGWAPRSRQVGVTGRSIAPRLYIALGLSGKFNHMVGVRAAGTVLAINHDPEAPVFGHADIGIVGDWHEVLPLLETELRQALKRDRTGQP